MFIICLTVVFKLRLDLLCVQCYTKADCTSGFPKELNGEQIEEKWLFLDLRSREWSCLAWGYVASLWQSLDVNPDISVQLFSHKLMWQLDFYLVLH